MRRSKNFPSPQGPFLSIEELKCELDNIIKTLASTKPVDLPEVLKQYIPNIPEWADGFITLPSSSEIMLKPFKKSKHQYQYYSKDTWNTIAYIQPELINDVIAVFKDGKAFKVKLVSDGIYYTFQIPQS